MDAKYCQQNIYENRKFLDLPTKFKKLPTASEARGGAAPHAPPRSDAPGLKLNLVIKKLVFKIFSVLSLPLLDIERLEIYDSRKQMLRFITYLATLANVKFLFTVINGFDPKKRFSDPSASLLEILFVNFSCVRLWFILISSFREQSS